MIIFIQIILCFLIAINLVNWITHIVLSIIKYLRGNVFYLHDFNGARNKLDNLNNTYILRLFKLFTLIIHLVITVGIQ